MGRLDFVYEMGGIRVDMQLYECPITRKTVNITTISISKKVREKFKNL